MTQQGQGSRSTFRLSNRILDPVQCLKDYIDRTCEMRPSDTKPLFISLKPPNKALKADTIGYILEEAICLVGLKDRGFTATLAMNAGILPETAMQVGRWKTKEVFFNHYVYPRLPKNYSEKILGSQESQ